VKGLFKIGELAKKAEVSVETLRYYGSENLLIPKHRSNSGYRLYSDHDEQKLNFILHAKKIGFSLQEIKRLLALRTNKQAHTCDDVKSYTGDKIREIEAKIVDLRKMQRAITNLHDACCGGIETAVNCTILNSLDNPMLFSSRPNTKAVDSSPSLQLTESALS